MIPADIHPETSALGKKTAYDAHYNPNKLFPIPRNVQRSDIHITGELPFFGVDLWNHYEVSWLNTKGKPVVALAEITYGCDSVYLIESKSMKLYFNSFNNTVVQDIPTLQKIVENDIAERIKAPVSVTLTPIRAQTAVAMSPGFSGIYLDDQDIDCSVYSVTPDFLTTEKTIVEETVFSDLLKSNCLVTHQPDWGSVQIQYSGLKINHAGLLRYIISFRNHNEFAEHCVERMFMDIQQRCQPKTLAIYGCFTRRGGLDINPYRSSVPIQQTDIPRYRLCRQ